jgi:hypothetical protein
LNNLGRRDPDLKKRQQWYANSLNRLVNHGYTGFYIFDNFGSLIYQIKNTRDLFTIVDNLINTQINKRFSNYFVDVLLTRPSTHHFVEKALSLQREEKMVIN